MPRGCGGHLCFRLLMRAARHPDRDAHGYANDHTDRLADSDAEGDTDRHTDGEPDSNANRHTNGYSDALAHINANTCPDRNSHVHAAMRRRLLRQRLGYCRRDPHDGEHRPRQCIGERL